MSEYKGKVVLINLSIYLSTHNLSIYPGVYVRVQGEGGPGREHRLPLRHDRQGLQPDEYPLREGTGLSYTAVGFSYSSWGTTL